MKICKPNAKYVFKQIQGLSSRYELISHEGADVPNFPAIYVKNPKKGIEVKGKKYIGKRKYETVEKYEYALELAGGKMFTGYNIDKDFPNWAYGDDKNPKGLNRNDAILIKLDGDIIEVYFFFGLKDSAKSIWESATGDEQILTVDPIFTQKENPPTE